MNHDIHTVRQAIGAFTYNEKGAWDMPDAAAVATVAAILETPDKPAIECVEDAVLLIAKSQEVLRRFRADIAGQEMKWLTVSMEEAESDTGLKSRTIEKHCDELGLKIENGEVPKKAIPQIKRLSQEKNQAKGIKGAAASHFRKKKGR